LAGGQRGDEASSWPEGRDGTPTFVKTGPEDAAEDSELDALFYVILVCIFLLKLKLYFKVSTAVSQNEFFHLVILLMKKVI
jgi:hypothetical protein